MDRLEDRYHVIAPDYPGFGQSPPLEGTTTFDRIADVMDGFTEANGLDRFSLYMFDFGTPVGFRLATRHPKHQSAAPASGETRAAPARKQAPPPRQGTRARKGRPAEARHASPG
jgi:pimeloyl-ACP methyl ester carboxylesterase